MDDLMQEPVAWGIVACNTGRMCQVTLDAEEVQDHNPKHITPLYTADQMREYAKQAVEAEREACAGLRKEMVLRGTWQTEYEEGFWDAVEHYEDAIRARGQS